MRLQMRVRKILLDTLRSRKNLATIMLAAIGSILFWIFLGLSSLVLFPLAVLIWLCTVLFDRKLVVLHQFTSFWASLYTWLNPLWKVDIDGREKIQRGQAYVMVANHQSLLDILVMFRLFVHFKWVSKIEIFRTPLVGWNMILNRYIKIRRGSVSGNISMMRQCKRALAGGSSVMIFPEGTRSVTGRLRSFKEGAFELAKSTARPILPLVISGTASALPKKGLIFRGRHHIRVHVLDALPGADLSGLEPAALMEKVRDMISAELETMKALPA